MKTTLALHWKALVNKLHPPLPLTPRDSQKLLNLLCSSFRRQLNQTYPTEDTGCANDHIHLILTSPLFLAEPVGPLKLADHQSQRSPRSPVWIRQMGQEPMRKLQDRIAAGGADLNLARFCLDAQMRKCAADSDVKTSMKISNAGSIAFQWLWSSGLERSLNFLKDGQFSKLLICFLVAEGRYDRIYSWLHRENELQKTFANDNVRWFQSRIIFYLIKAELLYGQGSASAVKIFLQKLNEFAKAKKRPKGISSRFFPAGSYMSMSLPQMVRVGDISVADYDSLYESTKIWCKPNTFVPAWLAIHHPEIPRPEIVLAYLQHLSSADLAAMPQRGRSNTVAIALMAADLFLAQSRRCELAWILEVLKTHFAKEIGLEACANESAMAIEAKKREEEGSNVQSLNSLALECGGSLAVDFLTRDDHATGSASG